MTLFRSSAAVFLLSCSFLTVHAPAAVIAVYEVPTEFISPVAMNDHNQIAFQTRAPFDTLDSVYRSNGSGSLDLLYSEPNPLLVRLGPNASINNSGDVAFVANTYNSAFTSNGTTRLHRYRDGVGVETLQTGTLSPSSNPFGTSAKSINDAGDVVYVQNTAAGTTLYKNTSGTSTTIFSSTSSVSLPTVNNSGQISTMIGSSLPPSLFIISPGNPPVEVTSPGVKVSDLGLYPINAAGQIVAANNLDPNRPGYLLSEADPPSLIVPGWPAGYVAAMAINDSGDIAYSAYDGIGSVLYFWESGASAPIRVLGHGDEFFGRIMTGFEFSPAGFNNLGNIAVHGYFDDNSNRILIVEGSVIPELNSVTLLALASAGALGFSRFRKRKIT